MTDVYVDNSKADDSGDGLTRANAKATILAAVGVGAETENNIYLMSALHNKDDYITTGSASEDYNFLPDPQAGVSPQIDLGSSSFNVRPQQAVRTTIKDVEFVGRSGEPSYLSYSAEGLACAVELDSCTITLEKTSGGIAQFTNGGTVAPEGSLLIKDSTIDHYGSVFINSYGVPKYLSMTGCTYNQNTDASPLLKMVGSEQFFCSSIEIIGNTFTQVTGGCINGCQVGMEYSASDDYAAGTTYDADEISYYDGKLWVSLAGSNIGNTPDSSPTYWALKDYECGMTMADNTVNFNAGETNGHCYFIGFGLHGASVINNIGNDGDYGIVNKADATTISNNLIYSTRACTNYGNRGGTINSNTFVGKTTSAALLLSRQGTGIGCQDMAVLRNVLDGSEAVEAFRFEGATQDQEASCKFDYNVYVKGSSRTAYINGTSCDTLAEIQAAWAALAVATGNENCRYNDANSIVLETANGLFGSRLIADKFPIVHPTVKAMKAGRNPDSRIIHSI